MSKTRYLRILILLAVLGFALGCSGGGEPPAPATEEAAPATSGSPADAAPGDEAPPPEEASASADMETNAARDVDGGKSTVEMKTSKGTILLELDPAAAPITVSNFIQYVEEGFYDGTIFHRVVPGFVIQGGGLLPDMTKKATRASIQNEADNGVRNLRGTICMARTPDPNSATSQFFINTKDNAALDFRDRTTEGWGYAVFGKVVEGMDVVDAIESVERTTKQGFRDAPVETVLIESMRVVR